MIKLKDTKYNSHYRQTLVRHYRGFTRQGIKNKKPIKFTRQEFIEYISSNKDFIKLYDAWDGIDNETRPIVIRSSPSVSLLLTDLKFTTASGKRVINTNISLSSINNIFKITDTRYKQELIKMYYRFINTGGMLPYTRDIFLEYIVNNTNYDELWLKYKDGKGDMPKIYRRDIYNGNMLSDIMVMSYKEHMLYRSKLTTIPCPKCKQELDIKYFGKRTRLRKIRGDHCLLCKKKYKRTKWGWCDNVYHKQIINSKKRKHSLPTYTKLELWVWVNKQPNFNKLYTNWVISNYLSNMRPSIDRLDDSKGYSFDNIQLVTWRENYIKQSIMVSKEISLTNVKTGKTTNFTSMKQAAEFLGTTDVTIGKRLRHKDNTFNGHTIT